MVMVMEKFKKRVRIHRVADFREKLRKISAVPNVPEIISPMFVPIFSEEFHCTFHQNDSREYINGFKGARVYTVRYIPVSLLSRSDEQAIYFMLNVIIPGLRRLASIAMQKPEVIFVLGGPGAGKGTTCTKIVNKTGYVHLSAGDLLREERARPGSEFGELIETHIKNGSIVPVEITCSLINRAMQTSTCQHKRFLIDGFPRNQDNLDGWNKEMSDKAIVKGVIFLECSKEICTRRCLNRGLKGSGRSDDNEASLIKRHETFVNDTMPIVKYYEERGLVYKFNSTKPPKKVFADVYEKLQEIGWADKE